MQRGAKKKTAPALVRQSIEIHTGHIDENSHDDENSLATSIMSKSISNNVTPKCSVCGHLKVKITSNFRCPNKCKKNKY